MVTPDLGLSPALLRQMAENNTILNLTNKRGNLKENKREKILNGLNFIESFVLRGQKIQTRLIRGV